MPDFFFGDRLEDQSYQTDQVVIKLCIPDQAKVLKNFHGSIRRVSWEHAEGLWEDLGGFVISL
jgi:hypothetical protein